MVSFSITAADMPEKPYALFGGYNSSQIVDGASGLKTFKNYPTKFKTWALLGQGMKYKDAYVWQIQATDRFELELPRQSARQPARHHRHWQLLALRASSSLQAIGSRLETISA